jgi:hypothetical protein
MRIFTTFLKLGSVLIVAVLALVSLNAVIDNSIDYDVSTEGLASRTRCFVLRKTVSASSSGRPALPNPTPLPAPPLW